MCFVLFFYLLKMCLDTPVEPRGPRAGATSASPFPSLAQSPAIYTASLLWCLVKHYDYMG